MKTKLSFLALAVLTMSAATAMAAPITPTGTFGSLPAATFGGSGIPNDAVQVTNVGGAVLGLTAHQRYDAPAVTNDGAGTFYAQTGASVSTPTYASWNFAFYIDPALTTSRSFNYKLFYDFSPASGNDQSTHGVISFGNLSTVTQDSWNLGMSFLAGVPPLAGVVPPAGTFDFNANGEYTFALALFDGTTELGRSAINVTAVPEPGTYAMFGAGLLGLAALRRRKAA